MSTGAAMLATESTARIGVPADGAGMPIVRLAPAGRGGLENPPDVDGLETRPTESEVPAEMDELAKFIPAVAWRTGRSESAMSKWLRRWAEEHAQPGVAQFIDGRWYVGRGQRFCDECGSFWNVFVTFQNPMLRNGAAGPAGGVFMGSERDRECLLAARGLLAAADAIRARKPGIRGAELAGELRSAAAWGRASELGLSVLPGALRRYAAWVREWRWGRRGRRKGAGGADVHADDVAFFDGIYLSTNQHSVAAAFKMTRAHAQEAGRSIPKLRWWHRRVARDIPHATKVRARLGERRFEADCVPKIARDYSDIPAGHTWVGDERTLDIFVRGPHYARDGRTLRVKLTAWADMRSRMIVGWVIDTRANSDTILSAFKLAAGAYGLPVELIQDNGEDYKAVAGKRRRKWDEFDGRRIGSVFEQCSITVHRATPYHPWAKPIESLFRKVKEGFDRWFATFTGGSPDEKPADIKSRLADPHNVPTLDQVRSAFEQYLRAFHAEPQSGNGTMGLPPAIVMERFRETRRDCDPAVLDLLCSNLVGPVKVGRDGVRHNGVLYGRFDPALARLQGREVWLRVDPECVADVVVCDEAGRPHMVNGGPVIAEESRLVDANQADLRTAIADQKRARKAMKKFYEHRPAALDTSRVRAVMKARAERAEAESAELRASMPSASPAEVSIVRPDIASAAKAVQARRQRRVSASPLLATGTDEVIESPCGADHAPHAARWDGGLRPGDDLRGPGILDIFGTATAADTSSTADDADGPSLLSLLESPPDESGAGGAMSDESAAAACAESEGAV